ncbi:phage tail tube protein [Salinibacillus xinjiangensis]|uniref:Capsid protein n=1 Tax=Salinibacillus xinjiangensis TaxID=1229268 RepID=A0A6G1X7X4_9BACI|nr:capsid protein [Salinibacillus xinjiangensis]MRG87005.1 capsid protein [Salinibacillus xinjiangensis]
MSDFLLQSKHKFEINTTPSGTATYAVMGPGFSSVEPGTNEETDQTAYLNDDGWLTTTVLGGQLTLTFSGHRYYGDPAQDFIFSKQIGLGAERETDYRWTLPDGTVIEGPITLAEITGPSGEANAKGEISVAVHFNGKPEVTSTP